MTRKKKEAKGSLDLEEKPRSPPEVPLGTTADRATNHASQDEIPSVKTEQKLSKVTPAILRKDKSRTARVMKTTTELDQRDQLENKTPNPIKFVEDELKTEGWHH